MQVRGIHIVVILLSIGLVIAAGLATLFSFQLEATRDDLVGERYWHNYWRTGAQNIGLTIYCKELYTEQSTYLTDCPEGTFVSFSGNNKLDRAVVMRLWQEKIDKWPTAR